LAFLQPVKESAALETLAPELTRAFPFAITQAENLEIFLGSIIF
jgi:hypothetical protein